MRTYPDSRIAEVVWETRRLQKLIDDGEAEQAKALAPEVKAKAAKLGLQSGYLSWCLAVAHDLQGELDMAFTHINDAMAQDPLHLSYHRSFDIICNHIREALCSPSRALDDASTPRLYELLQSAGEADVPCHLAMAKHLAATGRPADAMRILDALTLLAPISRDVWVEKGLIARAMGDVDEAVRCESEAAAISNAKIPYGIPAVCGAKA